jgi:6-phosphogluconolactonase
VNGDGCKKTARPQDGQAASREESYPPLTGLDGPGTLGVAAGGEGSTLDFGPRGQVMVVPDGSALAHAAARRFARAVEQAVAERGHAFVALSGGTTPKQMGTILAREPYRSRIPWDRIHFFWGDERWVPLGSPESNAGEARRGFLDLVPIPPANVHPWDTAAESPREAAAAYETELRQLFAEPSGIPRFDLVLLGMGNDGHTASLFPDTGALVADGRLAVANYVPKMDANRLTLTAPLLNAGREILFLVGGPGKADTLEAVLEGPELPANFPAQLIRPALPDSRLDWLVDEDAGAQLQRRDN